MKARLSLKARSIQLLAQREHSRGELRRKLMAHAVTIEREKAVLAQSEGAPPVLDEQATASAAQLVDELLDWLQAHSYLDEARFVESRVNARSVRFGNLRIHHELSQHGLQLSPEVAQQLKGTELARARDVWQRRFGKTAPDAADRARQMRFLAGRGFSSDVIHRVVQGRDDD